MLKFFSKGFSAKDLEDKHTRELLEQECWNIPLLEQHEIRVLMCQEVNAIQDVVLFDSQQLFAPAPGTAPSSASSTASDYRHHAHNHSSSNYSLDSPISPSPAKSSFKSSSMSSLFGSLRGDRSLPNNLSGSHTVPSRRPVKIIPSIVPKLMFGTTPMAYKGSTTKIHLLEEPPQIMLTMTFNIHPNDVLAHNNAASTRRGSFSSNNSTTTAADFSGLTTVSGIGDYRSHSRSSRAMPSFIPDPTYGRDDTTRNGSISSSLPNASAIPARMARPGFNLRRQRRASQTSMENGSFNPTPLPSPTSNLDSMGNAKPYLTQAARSKLCSIAVFIEIKNNTRLREFIFSHFALIESRLHHLQALYLELLLPACRNRILMTKGPSGNSRNIPDLPRLFFQNEARIIAAVTSFQDSLRSLYSTPRIQAPLWLNMNTYPHKKSAYAASFMAELIHLMEESPSSGELVSSAITAVLSHHMSWVPTVAPAEEPSNKLNPQGAYDPLWAQLSDIYGNIGTTSRVSRTIVCGTNTGFVRRLLYILSYFIRCNEVFQRVMEFKEDPESLLNPPKNGRIPNHYDPSAIQEDHENGSPATLIRSISIPKRPRIDTFSAARGSLASASVASRLTAIGEPLTPMTPLYGNDRPNVPLSMPKPRPLFDTSKPRLDSKDSMSTSSTPYQSRPTTPTTIESRPDSDRGSVMEENGHSLTGQGQGAHPPPNAASANHAHHHLRVDTMRSRTMSSDTLGTDGGRSDHEAGPSPATATGTGTGSQISGQEVLSNVPLPVSNVVCSFPPFPTPNPAEEKILPADVLFCKSYGRSLMAPYCEGYKSDFALMGLPKCDFLHFMETDMRDTMKHFEVQEKVANTVCIVADANTWKCNVFSARSANAMSISASAAAAAAEAAEVGIPLAGASSFGQDSNGHGHEYGNGHGYSHGGEGGMNGSGGGLGRGGISGLGLGLGASQGLGLGGGDRLEGVTMQSSQTSVFLETTLRQMMDLAQSGLSADLCLGYLEDRLLHLYQCGRMLSSMVREKQMMSTVPSLESMAPLLGLHRSDMVLILAICATYDDLVPAVFADQYHH